MDVEKDRTVDMICIMFEPKDESGITYQGFSLTFKKAEELSRRISALLLKYEN